MEASSLGGEFSPGPACLISTDGEMNIGIMFTGVHLHFSLLALVTCSLYFQQEINNNKKRNFKGDLLATIFICLWFMIVPVLLSCFREIIHFSTERTAKLKIKKKNVDCINLWCPNRFPEFIVVTDPRPSLLPWKMMVFSTVSDWQGWWVYSESPETSVCKIILLTGIFLLL